MYSKRVFSGCIGFVSGLLNGLLGAGGGIVLVPMLLKSGMERKKAHANSVCIILSVCIVSSAIYIFSEYVSFNDAIPYAPWGILGAIIGTSILPRINKGLLRKIFGLFSIWAAWRLLSR